MVIGFLGKGGSGKTTLATHFAHFLVRKGNTVLAVDADHNMDFSYNLGVESMPYYIGQAYPEILKHMQISTARELSNSAEQHFFSLSPKDPITEKYSVNISESLSIMVAGPHTESMLYGVSCSHGLTQPIRTYLPFLKCDEKEYAVVDEKAGTDGVGTGVTVGFSLAIIVAEATRHGLKAAKQIRDMLHFYKTPYIFVVNKAKSKDTLDIFEKELGEKPFLILPFEESFTENETMLLDKDFQKLLDYIATVKDDRNSRAKKRLENLTHYQNTEN